MDDERKMAKLLEQLKPFLDDPTLPHIMIPLGGVTAGSVARDAIERARVASQAISRAQKRR
ncbi:hypothetical protein OR214_02253 [Ralstonia pickettii OR214]|jgi:hypothetical protein|uniref:Uncharacterized protein n=2 Tax=Ralstonia pickettii TaxID=329 RepID=R0E983_RALPI|nr:hypothetical protein OR214_02253 [Ralstonia pickettii OR214]